MYSIKYVMLYSAIVSSMFLIWFHLYYGKNVGNVSSVTVQPTCPKPTENGDYIVRIIHQSWKTRHIPSAYENYTKSWTKFCFKTWKYMFWTDEDNLNLIKNHYPWFLKKYKALPGNIYKADVSRYFYLFHYGGIYTDLDNECLQPFEHLLNNRFIVFGAMAGQWGGSSLKEGYVQNSFMYSKPRQTFWLEVIYRILFFNKTEARPEHFTGPVMLSKNIDRYRKRGILPNQIKIYSPRYFNPFSWVIKTGNNKNCKTHNRMTWQEWQKCRTAMFVRGAYVVQYHAHSWKEK